MKAAVFTGVGNPLEVQDVELDAPGPHEVLVKTAAAGVCHSDLHFIDGLYPAPAPCILGHEPAGVVGAVGDQVTYLAPGDHVITCLSVFCGHCESCLSGFPNRCQNPATRRARDGAPRITQGGKPIAQMFSLSSFAEGMLVHENACVKVTKDIPLDRAALIGCGVTTGVGSVFNTAKVFP